MKLLTKVFLFTFVRWFSGVSSLDNVDELFGGDFQAPCLGLNLDKSFPPLGKGFFTFDMCVLGCAVKVLTPQIYSVQGLLVGTCFGKRQF